MYNAGLIWDQWIGWIIALFVLVIGLIAYSILSGQENAALEFVSNLLRFGR